MYATLPLPFVLNAGSKASLAGLISKIFGDEAEQLEYYALYQYGKGTVSDSNFSYWKPNAASINQWFYEGKAIANETLVGVDPTTLDDVRFKAGNVIWGNAYLYAYDDTNVHVYEVISVPSSVARKGIASGSVDPSDVVAAARKLDKLYGGVANPNDCHWIAAVAAAAAGAVLSIQTTNTDNPKLNEEYGFWRIAYRGTDHDATSDWSRLIEAGDIVRMGWKGGGFHTATILSVNKNGTFEVFDNAAGNGEINIHTVQYDIATVKKSVTIYRLADDHLFLVNGTSGADVVTGTLFTDKLVGGAGADRLSGGVKSDVLIGGAGADLLEGGPGADRFVYQSLADSRVSDDRRDMIVDFGASGSADRIDLRAIDANSKAAGNQRFEFVGDQAFSGKPGQLHYVQTEAGTDLYADVDGDGNADFSIHFDDVLDFEKGDFVL